MLPIERNKIDSIDIAVSLGVELHKRLEEVGRPDAIEVAARKSGCLAQVVMFDDAVYVYSPSMIEKYPDLEAYLNSFDSAAIAEDLGCDISEVCHPLEYSIDLREAKERASHVVQAIGVIGGEL